MALTAASPAYAQDAAPHLLPDSLNLEIVDGSIIPEDCQYPASITDTTRFEIACVTMPRVISTEISAQYVGQLGEQGWRQGDYVSGGMTAVRTDENNCRRVLNIFPSPFPASDVDSEVVVIWFALDRAPRCSGTQPG
ncbi:hypothetical protein ATE48_12395 [Candidatus Viadribacter manganicus]|uniref:Uncharacterized protein n=2 Tax=Candidatus Viadribacter manganicus TaxID=1759059 RepID=A0A1B1AJG5_9PROT|nr:hypothetical protein ATE48_12395 [Candidatus Viadribacter manganicus]